MGPRNIRNRTHRTTLIPVTIVVQIDGSDSIIYSTRFIRYEMVINSE